MSVIETGGETQKDPIATIDVNALDWNLANIVSFVNKTNINIDITLTVGGTLLSGRLISGKEYFESVAEGLNNSSPAEGTVGNLLAEYMSNVAKEQYSDGGDASITSFIHLANAQHFSGVTPIPTKGTYWRGRLCDVSGYSFGSLSIGEAE
ncbi:gas vesicle accessory protein GvpU [Aeromonas rivipollensis]|uniref:gas vesicle accessory protein GvpU n=1 Tax=Aeromonas rivipollensis TaxID=948519 RepID=UPI003CFDB86F